MFKFLSNLLTNIRGPKTTTKKYLDGACIFPEMLPKSCLSTCAVLHGGMLFISSIIYPPGSRRIKDSWCADVEILLVGKNLKKVQLVGPTYSSITGMVSDVVKTYE